MQIEQQKRKAFLLRENAGERKLPEYREKLFKVFGKLSTEISFLSLEASDEVREQFYSWVGRHESGELACRATLERPNWDLLKQELLRIGAGASDQELYIYLPDADCVGAFPLTEAKFCSHAVDLYQEFNETVYAVKPSDYTYAIMIDYFDDFFNGVKKFESIFYGEAMNLLRK